MFQNIIAFFKSVADGSFDFSSCRSFFADFLAALKETEAISTPFSRLTGLLEPIATLLPFLLLALALLELLFGKKLLGIQKFVACFLVGYAVGSVYVAPLLAQTLTLPLYLPGLVVGILAAVLFKYIYYAAVAVAAGYSVYILCYRGIPSDLLRGAEGEFAAGKMVVALIVAAVAVVLVFVLRKYIEMLGTSLLGGFFIAQVVIFYFYDFTTLITINGQPYTWLARLLASAILAIPGFIFQFRTRRRY